MKERRSQAHTYAVHELLQTQHNAIFANISSAVVVLAPTGEINYVNKYLERISHYKIRDLIGTSFFRIVAPESTKEVHNAFKSLTEGKIIKPYEIALLDKNGKKFYVMASAYPVKHGRSIAGIVGFATDISEHKQSVEDLSKMVKEFHLLYDIGRELTSTIELDMLFSKILMYLNESFGYGRVGILLVDDASKTLTVKATTKPFPRWQKSRTIAMGKGITGHVAKTGRPYLINDIKDEKRYIAFDKKSKSEICVPLKVGTKVIGVINVESYRRDAFNKNDIRLLTLIANQAAVAIDNSRLYTSLEDSYLDTIRALVSAMEAKDHYTRGHSERVRQYALAIADELGLSEKYRMELNYAGFLHDIGKIGISDYLLSKVEPLTQIEYDIIKRHPEIGNYILKEVKHLSRTCDIIKSEHERYDGNGYPNGLKAEKIPIGARIISVADAYDAMTTDRPYRKAITRQEAVKQLRSNAGRQFDPKIVKAFMKVLKKK